MKKSIDEIVLNRNVENLFQACLKGEKAEFQHIVGRQRNADILLYGFEFSHSKTYEVAKIGSEIGWGPPTMKEKVFKYNLLEILSSNEDLHDYLSGILENKNILNDLIDRKDYNINNSMNFNDFIESNSPTIKIFILKCDDLLNKVAEEKTKKTP